MTITEPGIYDGVDEIAYHSDRAIDPAFGPSLSASGAKTLIHSSAERYAYEREHGSVGSKTMDMGTLVHTIVLRSHDERIVVQPYDSLRSKPAQEWAAAREAEGRIIVTHKQVRQAIAVAKAIRSHPLAGAIFSTGRPEVTLYWREEVEHLDGSSSVITCRARVDWLRDEALVDLKTVSRYGSSEPRTFGRQAASLDYPMSAAHYSDGWHALTGVALPFVTVTVELEPPYFITVGTYHAADLDAGRARMARAKTEFATREASGQWADEPQVVTIPVPEWYAATA